MATKTLGLTGRDYSTMAAWASYVNALTLSAPEVLEVYNDGGAVADTAQVVISGYSGASSTNTITIHPGSGQGIRDNANKLTNALRYNASNGAALTNSAGYLGGGAAYHFTGGYIIVDGLQFTQTAANTPAVRISGTDVLLKNSIIQAVSTAPAVHSPSGAGRWMYNCLLIAKGSGPGMDVEGNGVTMTIENCTIVKIGSASSYGIGATYSTVVLLRNTAIVGFTDDTAVASSGTFSASCANNATSDSAFNIANAGNGTPQVSIAAGTDLESLTSGSEDCRIKAGSTKLIDTGVTISGITTDIIGQTRGATYDIGAWEFVGGAAPLTADSGSFNLTGQDVGLRTTRTISAEYGAYALTGQDVTLQKDTPGAFTMPADSGSYSWNGSDALGDYAMNAGSGSYALTGQDVTFTRGFPQNYSITADQGSYNFNGQNARLDWSGAPIVPNRRAGIYMGMRIGL